AAAAGRAGWSGRGRAGGRRARRGPCREGMTSRRSPFPRPVPWWRGRRRHTVAAMPIEPVDALRRIAYLLERHRESTYRVEAYRKAAAAILPLGEDEVRRR